MDGPNAEQSRYWNQEVGPTWVEYQAQFDQLVEEPGRIALERAAPRPGERVIDVGCGCGATVLELARRVGPMGRVLGLDLSLPMLQRARERVAAAGLAGAALELGDAQLFPFAAGAADLVFSRFGVMFFADPVAAFANLRKALQPGGRLAFVCWRALDHNEWVRVPMTALASRLTLPPPAPPDAPGPFAFAERERVVGVLERAGFSEIALDPVDLPLHIPGASARDAAAFLLCVGPTGRAVREAGTRDLAPLARELERALEPHVSNDGVRMRGAVWVCSARTSDV
jgi:SAM-dependent methyltransferase